MSRNAEARQGPGSSPTAEIPRVPSTGGESRIRTPDQRVRVFISSTLGELLAERQAARSSVEHLRLTPIMFESGARPHPPRTLYRSYLAQSDIFVGIYWQRYGWVAPDTDISGLEDELTLSEGMPRLIYLKRPAPEIEPRLEEMLHRLVETGASYRPFSDVTELRELLLDDLAVLLSERFELGSEASMARGRSNLPASTSKFIGRRVALADLSILLDDDAVRLVTLTGPGGTGKTRLAIEAARAAGSRFPDGVLFVDLSAERRPEDVFAAIDRVVGAGGPSGRSALERVEYELGERRALLVLDNLEQVTMSGPGLVELLTRCPGVKIVATSREALRVNAEYVFAVPTLSLPGDDDTTETLEDVLRSESGRLFVERASAVGSDFVPTAGNAADIAAICRRLDGLPLAIELAAARLKLFSVGELRARLDDRLDLLTGGGRDRPDRQRTLRDAVDWSYELLGDDERMVSQLFSVFAGGRLDDIEATFRGVQVVGEIDIVETLTSLLDKNLVRVAHGVDRSPRFSMLQVIREYAVQRLAGSPELLCSVRQAHAIHYTGVAVDLRRRMTCTDRAAVLEALGDELGNLRAAWEFWVARRDVARLDELLAPLWGFHEARGDYAAAIALGEALLRTITELPESRERQHDELALRATLARTQLVMDGFTANAERAMVEALNRFEASPTASQRFPALRGVGALQLWRSDFDGAAATAQDLMSIAEEEREPSLLTEAHLMACISTSWVHDVPAAVEHAEQAAAYFEAAASGFVEFRVGPNPGVVANAIGGLLRWEAGLPDTAASSMARALDLADELDHPYSRAFALHHATLLDFWRSDLPSVRDRSEKSLRLADAHDYAIWTALAHVFHGAATVVAAGDGAGLGEMERGFALYQELTTPPIFWPALLVIRAVTHARAGDGDRALELMEEATAGLGGDDHPAAAHIAIAHGDLLLAAGAHNSGAAHDHFDRAAALSAQRGARMLELQALTRLAAAHHGSSSGDVIRERLRSLHETFTEGFDTPPLLDAAATLSTN